MRHFLLCWLFFGVAQITFGQQTTLEFSRNTNLSFADVLKADSTTLPKGTLLLPPASQFQALLTEPTGLVSVVLPYDDNQTLRLDLVETNGVLADDFVIRTSDGQTLPRPALRFYRGTVSGNAASSVALTLSAEGLEGMIHLGNASYTLGRLQNRTDGLHILYDNKADKQPLPSSFCTTIEQPKPPQSGGRIAGITGVGCRYVRVYYETDFATYQAWGSNSTTVSTRVATLFNQVSTLYANENVEIRLSELYIWTAADPYASASNTSAALTAFKNRWNGLGNTFNGNVAHLLSTRNLGGGIAYYYSGSTLSQIRAIFAYGAKDYAFGVDGNLQNNALSYPTYSWNVMVMAHELGHNFGLPHTQSCLWSGGPIDNCYGVEDGTCSPGPAPTNGGTIMSYCHLTSNGINLANGFGTLPRAKMQTEVTNASSLSTSFPVATIGSNTTISTGLSATLTMTLTGGFPQSLTLSNGQAFSNITTSPLRVTVTPLTTTVYTVTRVTNSCGTGTFSGAGATITVNCPQMYTLRSGNWNDATLWSCQRVPLATDNVLVSAAHVITIPSAVSGVVRTMRELGRVVFLSGSRLRIGP
jgi:hypothetical protein